MLSLPPQPLAAAPLAQLPRRLLTCLELDLLDSSQEANTPLYALTPPPPSLRDTYPLVMLSTVGPSTLEFATASLEWMADGVTRAFEMGRGNPLKLR